MAGLTLRDVRKTYGGAEVIRGVDLEIAEGEFTVFVGPSGCGKSTLLRMIAGLEEISDGEIEIGGEVVNDVEARDRGVAMVFQSYALYPHMTVAENMGFGLRLAKVPKPERAKAVEEAARILQMEHLLDRRPAQLSGGQRQRVAIGRAITRQPEVFLFDEPLSNLDAALRMDMRMELAALHRDLKATMIYVTHDQVEAMTLADRIVVLDKGVVQQVGSPLDLYDRPVNVFVAGFIGSPRMNLIEVRVDRADAAGAVVSGADLAERAIPGLRVEAGETLTLGIRPHALRAVPDGPLRGTVDLIERLGHETVAGLRLPGGAQVTAALGGRTPLKIGEPATLDFDDEELHVFGPDGEAIRFRD
ncbi:ABC transporter ATP-binding protein [Pseudoroseicyclus aestuarii]|uniref:Multiple sugar transport system ATP-binding protein n=1 Tax=Pseudoroseicyclus aestuarii TaxID=1795041 RepID=A0A318SNA1_9RHOB|nr:sn-glycerol-3-phosphate ABC transporter ATP-binding protein UgpC [Pseudoroseicyclus aestuarii]PYE81342.1 multiple sugar transport system ATP-binding protein [Pseudoroseicyclus aestuarii]